MSELISNPPILNSHQKISIFSGGVICNFCNETFPSLAALLAHMTECHNECNICFRIFECRQNLVQHMKSHDPAGGNYSCYCLMKFHNMPSMRYHLAKDHGAKEFLCCTSCPKAFETQSQFNFHKRIHMTENVPCSLCYTILKSPVHLKVTI